MALYTGSSILDILISNATPNGTHVFTVNDVNLGDAEVINFYGDHTITHNTNLTSSGTYFSDVTAAQDNVMCVRIFHGNLIIGDSSNAVTFTPPFRTKGFFVLVKGNLTINSQASVSMTARGSNAPSQNVVIWTGATVPATGQAGASGASIITTTSPTSANGRSPSAATGRATGGGGSGGARKNGVTSSAAASGSGGTGTSWAGGGGSGGVFGNANITGASASGVNGGAASINQTNNPTSDIFVGGGAGVTGGSGRQLLNTFAGAGSASSTYKGADGAGGLLMVACMNSISGNGSFSSKGSNGSAGIQVGGGSSGGGSVNVLYRSSTITTADVTGGALTDGTNADGGAGGEGSATFETLSSQAITIRRSLFKKDSSYYYYNFSLSSWVEVTDTVTEAELVKLRGMFDGELLQMDRAKLVALYGSGSMSTVTLKTHNG